MTGSPRWIRGADAEAAWAAWADGDTDRAEKLATALAPPQREHLLFLVCAATGRHTEALNHYRALPTDHSGLSELDEPVAEAWLHLDEPGEALAHVRRRVARRPRAVADAVRLLEQRAARPLTATLPDVAEVPFTDHELSPYLPAFEATVDGRAVRVHLDTGGTHLVMGPARAAELGLRLTPGRVDRHALSRTRISDGMVGELRLGAATLANVPVEVLSTLTGPQDMVIVGTSLLARFLSTVDYPGRRLLLSPRRDPATARRHRAALRAGPTVEMPFLLWGDHYMLARGGYGAHACTYFVDSGLVHVIAGDDGRLRQACLIVRRRQLRRWGVPRHLARRPYFVSPDTVSLGPLRQADHLVMTTRARRTPWGSLGGIRVDGLLSHAFLSRYTWTIDVDRHRYTFIGT